VTTLLWVACVLPSGVAAPGGVDGDAATPMHRAAILLVPALLLLITVPAGCTLSRRRRGMRAVLASTDAFVLVYAAVALWSQSLVSDAIGRIALGLLASLGALSLIEAWRCTRPEAAAPGGRAFSGVRLAICMLVLIVPLQILVRPDVERASLLAPFLFVAISAGGARLARDMRGLRRTAAVLQALLAAHVVITLRFTIHRGTPTLVEVGDTGRVTMGLAFATLGTALLQLVLLLRRRAPERPLADAGARKAAQGA
jgi:hypothetical protein